MLRLYEKNLLQEMIKFLYIIYYKLHLVYCFLFRPKVEGSYCLIFVDDYLLIIKNSYKTYWTVPCGGINKGEEPIDAAIREVEEEVGLNLEAQRVSFIKVILNTTEYKKDRIHLFNYRMNSFPEVKIDDKEVVDYKWVKVSDTKDLPLFHPIKQFLLDEGY